MENIILKTNNLSKKYGAQIVNDNINLELKQGQIYGLIGKNGAGKTTLIRMICGLIHKSNGEISIFGKLKENELDEARTMIGSLIETPAFYLNMTARENLEVSRLVRNVAGKNCINEVLELVGLKDAAKKKVKNFSLGMKQRLGIANALLGNPRFLILDEPINGLDPIAIVEIREILKKINKEKGITILISSHILGELSELANCYGIIDKGRLLEQVSDEELKNKCRKYIEMKVSSPEQAVTILEKVFNINDYEVLENNIIKIFKDLELVSNINLELSKNDIMVEKIGVCEENLENYFINIVGGSK